MGLFKKRGKHVRSAKKKSSGEKSVEEETVEASTDEAQADDGSDVGDETKGEANELVHLGAPSEDARHDEDDAAEESPSGDAADAAAAPVASDAETADKVDESSKTVAIDPKDVTDTKDVTDSKDSGADYAGGAWSGEVATSAYEPISEADAAGFKSADIKEVAIKKKRRGLKVFGVTMGVIVILVCVAYVAGAVVFMGRFLPNTTIGEYNVSFKTDSEVIKMLEDVADDYQIDVVGNNGFSYRATGSDVGLAISAADIVASMHTDLNAWSWPVLITQSSHDESGQMTVKYDSMAYEPKITEAVNKFNENATPPTNATIAFDEKSNKFVVKEEALGTQLDVSSVLAAFDEAVDALQTKVVLDESELLQPTVLSTDEKLVESAKLATGMVSAKLTLTMGGKQVGEVAGESLSQFVTIDENLDVTFKTDEMNAWVDELTAGFDTVGSARTFTRADGKEIRVSGGVYGWETDKEALKTALLDGIKSGSTAQIEVPCTETAAVYNGAGQRDWGNRYLDVDISEQHVRFYGDDGGIIWETDCITGMPDGTHDTVPGVWCVNAKESPSKLVGYENGKKIYETTVTYWMPFEGNGIGFHDATWQPSFGGTMYANGYGSHGCVNLSYSAAQELYGIIQEGDVVVVHS